MGPWELKSEAGGGLITTLACTPSGRWFGLQFLDFRPGLYYMVHGHAMHLALENEAFIHDMFRKNQRNGGMSVKVYERHEEYGPEILQTCRWMCV